MDSNASVPGGAQPSYALALWNLVIRPPRAQYDVKALGPKVMEICGVTAVREDLQLRTPRGSLLQCSHYQPQQVAEGQVPVIVYLHGNASCRLEAFDVLHSLLSRGLAVFCYDAAGCGHSEGEYISLGWHERDDLAFIIEHLRKMPRCGAVGLWGRSMGAVTALMQARRDPTLGVICLDSPFASFPELMWELGNSEHALIKAPDWLFGVAVSLVRMRVQALADFDVEDVVPLRHVSETYPPALFIHAERDSLVASSHSRRLYEAYAGDKAYMSVTGDHNTSRGLAATARAVDFVTRALRHSMPQSKLPRPLSADGSLPPLSAQDLAAMRGSIAADGTVVPRLNLPAAAMVDATLPQGQAARRRHNELNVRPRGYSAPAPPGPPMAARPAATPEAPAAPKGSRSIATPFGRRRVPVPSPPAPAMKKSATAHAEDDPVVAAAIERALEVARSDETLQMLEAEAEAEEGDHFLAQNGQNSSPLPATQRSRGPRLLSGRLTQKSMPALTPAISAMLLPAPTVLERESTSIVV
eukprot:TRINITY_DN2943_c0_g2_i1.p1 TRINITY_DN2943_c0_g2~~TRINITY_DN2943_c0_g2_i1.p1  ORF type:complete len:528 (-),score=109.50 TRINITY_DN2943_c0_g2_i1:171-1754(-)